VQPDAPTSRHWSTPVGLVVLGWVLAVAAALWWLTSRTTSDRVFVGMVVVALALASAYASACRPRLYADSTGIAVRGLRGTRRWPWSRVTVTVQRRQRLGRSAELLELEVATDDTAGDLIILTRLDLGEAPHDVAETLRALRS
jgi:hypothetical protein